ncbi:pyridoxal-dependent decarboxylase [Lewinella sp. W8]|uniref:pyridoxal phosphate-dependent decarboxylase family protein n=1 Tax=Lewinella sp. W8 TaxID=2528208 RepID=UPI001067D420|nr:pyridoxal-dependent decarboxylase [Lewinella sp. W8]MTB52973.1 pyridoxal-dependent decarboxylase [Lewinella sp. W8]
MMDDLSPDLQRAYAPQTFREMGHALVDQLADYLDGVDTTPANVVPAPEDLLEEFRGFLSGGTPPKTVFRRVIDNCVHVHSPNYLGHQVNPPVPAAALADLVNGILNGSTAIFEMGAPGAVMERLVVEKFSELLGLPESAGGFLTHGGTLANLTALLAARAARWPDGDPWKNGNSNVRPCVLVNEQAHYCIDRAVRIMGWGDEGIISIPCDDAFRIRTDEIVPAIRTAIAAGKTPIALIGSAGTTSTGSFDDLATLAVIAKEFSLWYHIDGAHGAPAGLDPSKENLVTGMKEADSIAMDFHKMLMTPGLTTALFFRQNQEAYRTFHQRADYLLSFETGSEDWYNMGRRTFECTKSMISLRVFILLSTYGERLFRDYVIRVNELGQKLAELIREKPNLELATPPDLNIVCFRHRPAGANTSQEALNHLNSMIRARMLAESQYYIVQTTLHNQVYLRCTLTNPMTGEAELEGMLEKVVRHGNELQEFKMNLPW